MYRRARAICAAVLCTENLAVVKFFPVSDSTSADLISDCNTTDYDFVVALRENGVANEGNRTAQLHLVLTPLDQDGIIFHINSSLTILDLDSKEQ